MLIRKSLSLPLIQDIKRDLRDVLDLGAGAGHFSRLLDKTSYGRNVTMLESSCTYSTLSLRYNLISATSAQLLRRDEGVDDAFEGGLLSTVWAHRGRSNSSQPNSARQADSRRRRKAPGIATEKIL